MAPNPDAEQRDLELATELDTLSTGADQASAPRAWLLVRGTGGTSVIDLPDGGSAVIGRGREAAIRVDDTRVSRVHAKVWREGLALHVEDLGSRNGTKVNDIVLRSMSRRLAAGDVIRVAECEAVVALTTETGMARQAAGEPAAAAADASGSMMVVADAAMNRVVQVARRLALVDTSVLILGETGAGKEVLAREIHLRSARSRAPFVRVNCPALAGSLLESELFGYEKGAFTGAACSKIGLFEAANGGTLLLDELGDFPLAMQVKLLSVLENRCVLRVGSTKERPIDVRVLCATHRDLQAEVAAGRFREDLFYRIAAFTLKLPPLRQRPAEILVLAGLFLKRIASHMGRPPPMLSPEAASMLTAYPWPGNVRELRNAIEHAMVLQDGVIAPAHLPDSLHAGRAHEAPVAGPMRAQLSGMERASIERALTAENGNQTRAAQHLGISRRALIYKMRKYGLQR
jgi:transcriptional regulator with PAS, ATPase and Fis domain